MVIGSRLIGAATIPWNGKVCTAECVAAAVRTSGTRAAIGWSRTRPAAPYSRIRVSMRWRGSPSERRNRRRCGGRARPARRHKAGVRCCSARAPPAHRQRLSASASARLSASIAAFITPVATCGRATKAASPTSATRPNAMRGDSRSKIGCRMICAVSFTSAASCGASSASASCLSAAISSGRISGGGIETPCRRPLWSVQRPARALSVDRPEPDEMAGALAVAARRRHRDRQHQFAVRKAEHHPVEHQVVKLGRKLVRLDHAAPGHIAGIAWRELGEKLRANRGMQSVGCDQQIALGARAVVEDGD